MTAAVRRAAIVAVMAAAWASAGEQPLVDAAAGAHAPIDFARDYVSAHARVHGVTGGHADNDYAAAIGVPRVVLLEAPYYVHPPSASLFVLPLVPLGFEGAARAWLALSLGALAVLAFALAGVAARDARPPAAVVCLGLVLLTLWPPVLHNLAKGQWSIFLAALVAAGWRALERGRPRAAGVLVGLAASLKATPVLLLGYLFLRHRRAAWAMSATLAAAVLTSLAVFGVEPWRAWIVNARPNALAWQTWIANTASLNGLFARLFAGGAFARPLVAAPALAQALTLGGTAILGAALLVATRRAPASPAGPTADDRRLFAAWIAVVVVANPLAWTHTVIVALLPLALLARDAPPAALVLALVVLTVPRETLAVLAGPLPVSPGRGLALSAHAGALLLLVGAALRPGAARAPGPARSAAPP